MTTNPLVSGRCSLSVSVCGGYWADKIVTVLRVPVSSLLVIITITVPISEGVVSIRGSVSVLITANQETKP